MKFLCQNDPDSKMQIHCNCVTFCWTPSYNSIARAPKNPPKRKVQGFNRDENFEHRQPQIDQQSNGRRCKGRNSTTDKNSPLGRHKDVECTDEERLKSDWEDEVKFNENYDEIQDELCNMLLKFKDMLDSHLDQINAVKNRIKLTMPEVTLIHSVPYQAGLRARESGRDKIDKLFSMNVIELAQPNEWLRMYSHGRKRELYTSVSIIET